MENEILNELGPYAIALGFVAGLGWLGVTFFLAIVLDLFKRFFSS